MTGGAGVQRLSSLVSRLSMEPLAGEEARQWNGSLSRDGSGVSAEEAASAEYESWREEHPCALHHFDQIAAQAAGKLVAVFLDYDGTLTPIVSNPDMALMSEHTRGAVRRVAQLFPTAIISGRGREKVQQFVRLEELYYAGSHGMDIVGPQVDGAPHADLAFQPAAQYAPLMDSVYQELLAGVDSIAGSSVEHNKFCVSVHFRNCAPEDYPAVVDVVDRVSALHPELRITRGRKVLEVRPQVDWDKGAALAHLLEMLGLADPAAVFCLYIGDDRTDEDAFRVLAERRLGGGVLVSTKPKATAGLWTLRDPTDVAAFLNRLVAWGQTESNRWHNVGACTGWGICPTVRRSGVGGGAAACNGGSISRSSSGSAANSGPGSSSGGGGGSGSGSAHSPFSDAAAVAAAFFQDGQQQQAQQAFAGLAGTMRQPSAAAALQRPPLPRKPSAGAGLHQQQPPPQQQQ